MYKVIVVDDEVLIRKRIIFGFDWERFGFEIVNEAEDGSTALELINKQHFDLAIVDIEMPGLNGIEMARKIWEQHCQLHIVFLTGHSNFDYAQQAIHYGVKDYLLKPVNEKEFVEMLENIRDELDEEGLRKKNTEQMEVKRKNFDMLVEAQNFSSYFHSITPGVPESAKIRSVLEDSNIRENGEFYICAYDSEAFNSSENSGEIERTVNLFNELFKNSDVGELSYFITVDIYNGYVIIIIQSEGIDKDKVFSFIQLANKGLNAEIDHEFRCGVSAPHNMFSQINISYGEAVSSLYNARIAGIESMTYDVVLKRATVNFDIPDQVIKKFQYFIVMNQFEQCQELIEGIFNDLLSNEIEYGCMITCLNKLLFSLVEIDAVSRQNLRHLLYGNSTVEPVINNMSCLQDIKEWFCNLIYSLITDKMQFSGDNRNFSTISKICDYIGNNYQNPDLSLSLISEEMAMTPSYISSIFKKAMKTNLVQYITMIRMKKAREFLQNTKLDIRDISEKVGYRDEYYFSKSFKKQYGISPNRIKKMEETQRFKNSLA